MHRALLVLFDALRPLLSAGGVDYPRFRLILETKLRLDTLRRSPAMAQLYGKKKGNTFALTLWINAFFGLFVALTLLPTRSALVGFTIVHSLVMVMIAMSLVADFSVVLLDTGDHQILAPRPVSPRTILVARVAHIGSYVGLLALSLTACSFIAAAVKFGWWTVPALAATLVLSSLLVIGLVVILYLAVMRFFDEEKVRDIIVYMQIVMSVMVVAGYQLMPRLMDFKQLRTLDISDRAWVYLYPPTWFAALIDLAAGNAEWPRGILAGMGALAPLLVFAAVLRLGSGFRTSLGAEGGGSRRPGPGRRFAPASFLARWLARNGEERAAFEWTWSLCARSRHFKLRTYPGVALVFVLGLFFLLADDRPLREALTALSTTDKHLVPLYFAAMMFPMAAAEVRFTDQPAAAWIYLLLPVEAPGRLLLGTLKAVACRFVAPAFGLVGATVLALWGARVALDLVLAAIAAGAIAVVFARFQDPMALPFSLPVDPVQRRSRLLHQIGLMLLGVLFGLIHWGLIRIPLGVPVAIPVTLALVAWLGRRHASTTWQSVKLPAP